MVRIIGVAILLLLINRISNAQFFHAKNYPKGYFTWPVDAKKALAANFGELRPNHYHMGLDCKTDQKENRPVLSAAGGYIAKVKIEPIGFGRCIYINHPNGLTTLYAHLNDFYPALEKYIADQQYKLQSWKVFLDIPPGLFPVKQGQFIAYSGNTGGSQGPHLHFEIRDTKTDKVLNPLLFGFPVLDKIAPDILRLAVYDRRTSTYQQQPRFYFLKKINGVYTTTPRLVLTYSDKISFAITAYDRYTGSTNKNGIYEAVLYNNGEAISGFQIDSISYDETRYLNAHIDYKLRNSGGSYVQHLGRLPGYPPGVYKSGGDGTIMLQNDSAQSITIEVKDTDGNTSTVAFAIKKAMSASPEIQADPLAVHQPTEFHPGFINVFESSNISFYLPENALYDSIRFTYKEIIPLTGHALHQLHNSNVPVHSMFPVRIKCTNTLYPGKMVMHRFANDKNDYARAVQVRVGNEDDWFESRFRAFGNFQLITDTIPPSVVAVGFREGMNTTKLNRLAFVVKDNTKELANFKALLDGKWIRFSNDKGSTFIYKFDDRCPPGAHELKITVEDCVGNTAERTYHFTR